jgi:hypothetical protein
MAQNFSSLFAAAEQEVRSFLVPAQNLSPSESRKMIAQYTAAIAGNFVPWMAAASVSARSLQGRFACEENLFQEMCDDHPGMLEQFSLSANAQPTLNDTRHVIDAVQSIRTMVSEMNGLKNIALMTCLEGTSKIFIPYLAELATRRGSKNLAYTDAHGVADAKHAEQFLWAISYEEKFYENTKEIMDTATQQSLQLLRTIFVLKKSRIPT